MSAVLDPHVLEDEVVVSLARVVAAANKRARELGVNLAESRLSISEQVRNGKSFWRVNYGPRNPVGRRGGDVIIDVDATDGSVTQIISGQ